jgi:hypothetical protein
MQKQTTSSLRKGSAAATTAAAVLVSVRSGVVLSEKAKRNVPVAHSCLHNQQLEPSKD